VKFKLILDIGRVDTFSVRIIDKKDAACGMKLFHT
jgi:hypothetical protein